MGVKPLVIEAGAALDGSSRVWYRFACQRCPIKGEYLATISSAERAGYAHQREHGQVVGRA